jgi:hypothetical protein
MLHWNKLEGDSASILAFWKKRQENPEGPNRSADLRQEAGPAMFAASIVKISARLP